MKALFYTAVGRVEMGELPKPEAGPGEVLVRVSATGICGSDLSGFLGHSARRQPGLVLGHEATGVVVSPGPLEGKRVSINPLITCGKCDNCRAGRHNVCQAWSLLGMDRRHGAFAEFVTVPERNVLPLPDSVSDMAAVMIEPLANAIHLVAHTPPEAGLYPRVAVMGGGTLGAAITAVALARGMKVELVTEPNPRRAGVIKALGVERVVDPASDEAKAVSGLDVVFEAVGIQASRAQAVQLVKKGGSVMLLGLHEGPTTLDFWDVVRREIRLQGSFGYAEKDYDAAMQFVMAGKADFTPWSDLLPIEKGQEAFDRLTTDPGDRIKLALVP